MMEFVSWDDEIPKIWKVIKFHGSKAPPTRLPYFGEEPSINQLFFGDLGYQGFDPQPVFSFFWGKTMTNDPCPIVKFKSFLVVSSNYVLGGSSHLVSGL